MRINNLLIRFSRKYLVWEALAPNNERVIENLDREEVLRQARENTTYLTRTGYRPRRLAV